MIGWLRGRVIGWLGCGELLLDVNGVGYRVNVPLSSRALIEEGAELELYVHTHVREDAIVLYGFCDQDQRRCFEALLGAHGVGPSLALGVISAMRPDSLVRAVMSDDIDLLCSVPGIGRKTAARLVLDLKAKLDLPEANVGTTSPGRGPGENLRSEVRAALGELGYGPDEIRRALESIDSAQLDEPGATVEEVLRLALRQMTQMALSR